MKNRLMLFVMICLLSFFTSSVTQGALIDSVKEYVRPFVEKTLGQSFSNRIFGEVPPKIVLPPIPRIKRDATDTRGLGRKDAPKNFKISRKLSKKFNYLFVNEVYTAVFIAKLNPNAVAKWFNILEQGGTREGVYRALVLSSTYKGLENSKRRIDERGINFAIKYMERFLGLTTKKGNIKRMGLFTLKRLIVERTLEIIDELSRINKDHLYRWYAVFSADMARDFPGFWTKNKMRRVISRERHMNWAKTVPEQYIKSEVIIKLHQILNAAGSRHSSSK